MCVCVRVCVCVCVRSILLCFLITESHLETQRLQGSPNPTLGNQPHLWPHHEGQPREHVGSYVFGNPWRQAVVNWGALFEPNPSNPGS